MTQGGFCIFSKVTHLVTGGNRSYPDSLAPSGQGTREDTETGDGSEGFKTAILNLNAKIYLV